MIDQLEYVPKPNGYANGPLRYPRFTKQATASILDALPNDAQFQQGSPTLANSNGPLFSPVIDLDTAYKSDGTRALPPASRSGRYAMLVGPDHATGDGGQWLYWGASPTAFAIHSDTAVIDGAAISGNSLEASRAILWNPAIEKFVIYPHISGTPQITCRLTSTNLTSWTAEAVIGGECHVITGSGSHYGYGATHAVDGEMRMNHRLEGTSPFLWGQSKAVDPAWKHWEFTGLTAPGHPHPYADDTISDVWLYMNVPQIFELGGRKWGVANWREQVVASHGTRNDQLYIAPFDADGFTPTGPWKLVVAQGGVGAFDEVHVAAPTVLIQRDAVYLYYTGINSSFVGGVGVAKCQLHADGSYDSQ